jgi:hypothetical protein
VENLVLRLPSSAYEGGFDPDGEFALAVHPERLSAVSSTAAEQL